MRWVEGLRARLRLLFAPGAADARMEEEIRFHIEMETERLEREEGLERGEARRRALVAFGGVEQTREELRSSRGLAWLSGLRLDVKLGARMLVRYPVLTTAGVLALAVAFALAASWFEFMTDVVGPRLPLPEAERVVQVRHRDVEAAANRAPRLHDFERWRDELRSIRELGAAASVELTVTTESGRSGTFGGARVTPALLRTTRVQPILGRSFTDGDFEPAASPSVVLGYGAWQRLFDGDPAALGETVRVGAEHATVVGVMPEGFGFPVNQELWTPLREGAGSLQPAGGPPLMVVGRLAPGATLEEAGAELAGIGRRTAGQYPDTHEYLRPAVNRFGRGSDMAAPAALLNLPFLFFLLVVSANVATLLFARTATRESEIALRSALGASRRRILLQLVAEALVMTSVAAALGLAGARWGRGWGMDLFWEVQQMRPPFWFDAALAPSTVVYIAALAILGALIIGGVPGLRATRRQIRDRLPQPGAGGAGMKFGLIATGVIVVQVTLCVALIPVAIMGGRELLPDPRGSEFPAESFLSGRLTAAGDGAGAAGADGGAGERFDEVQRRLAAEPGVLATARASRLPGFNHPVRSLEIDGDSARTLPVRALAVDPDFFDLVEARIVSGRGFTGADVAGAAAVAVVEQAWAQEAFRGRNPIGRWIRYPDRRTGESGAWHEVVGVVAGIERAIGPGEPVVVFHPLRPGEHASVQLYLRTAGPPAGLVPGVHDLVASVDPTLAVVDLEPLEEAWRPVERANAFFATALAVVAAIILLFALIGIYALMSFTVAQRAREIGIRAALGADPRHILGAVFSRALIQIGLGIVAGGTLVSLTAARTPGGLRLVGGVALAMAAVGLLGCLVPVARALRIQPGEALRVE